MKTTGAIRKARCKQLLETLRQYNRLGRFYSKAYGSELSTSEMYILVELDIDGGCSVRELAGLLNLDASSVSRAIKHLIDQNCLTSGERAQDKRRRILKLTGKGSDFLKLHDQFNERFLGGLAANLSLPQLNELRYFLDYLAGQDGAPPLKLRAGENPLLSGVRRLARSWSIGGDSFLGTSYSLMHWHILTEADERGGGLRPSQIAELYSMPRNTVSQLIARLEREGLIKRAAHANDTRGVVISLAAKGKRALEVIVTAGIKRLERALINLELVRLERFCDLLNVYVTGAGHQRPPLVLQEQTLLQEIRTPAELEKARELLNRGAAESVAAGRSLTVLGAQESVCYAAKRGDEFVAVAEFHPSSAAWELINFYYNQDEPITLGKNFLRNSLMAFFNSIQASKVLVGQDRRLQQSLSQLMKATRKSSCDFIDLKTAQLI